MTIGAYANPILVVTGAITASAAAAAVAPDAALRLVFGLGSSRSG